MSTGKRSSYLRSGLVALGVLVVIGVAFNYLFIQSHRPGALYGPLVSDRISQGLQVDTHTSTPPSVTCPAREPRRAGLTFTCTLVNAAGSTPVTVHETDGRGDFTFRVDPRSG